MIDFFKPEDLFHCIVDDGVVFGLSASGQEEILRKANKKLERALGPKVYMPKYGALWCAMGAQATEKDYESKAYLFDIQEIKKEPCKHFRVKWYNGHYSDTIIKFQCEDCQKLLKPKWEEV